MTIFLDDKGMVDLHLIAIKNYPDMFLRKGLNNDGYADALWFRKDGKVRQVEIKRGLEANPTQLTEQLQRQRPMADITDLMIIGPVTASEGGSTAWQASSNNKFIGQSHTSQMDFMWYRRELSRFEDEGTRVYELPTPEDAITQLVALYRNDQEPKDGIFNRLIVEKKYISEEDESKRKLALTLMGISDARLGEEMSIAIASNVKSLTELVHLLESDKDEYNGAYIISNWRLNSGRRIGDAAVIRLKQSLGIRGGVPA